MPVRTVLGKLRNNPFTVQNMTTAYNQLHNTQLSALPTTDLYVKFTPNNIIQFRKLMDLGIPLFDIPFEYEVTSMGDYYFESTNAAQMPPMYGVVKPDFAFPSNIPYQITPLHINRADTALLTQALIITGNDTNYKYPPLDADEDNGGGGTGGSGGGTLYTTNSCGCTVYNDTRRPGGCVKVEDKELLNMVGVRRVKVIVKDTWFTVESTYTDDNGCWKINTPFKNHVWMWVIFENSRNQIRAVTSDWRMLYQWAIPVIDFVGYLQPANFNNLQVNYYTWKEAEKGTNTQRFWGASMINNAVHEFYDYALLEGINPPPNERLDIFSGYDARAGYALMHTQQNIAQEVAELVFYASVYSTPFATLVGVFAYALVIAALPEIHIGMGHNDPVLLKKLAFHELAHTSHYSKVGNNYWWQLVKATIAANGHGCVNSCVANLNCNLPLLSLCESWPAHVSYYMVTRKYPTNSYFDLPVTLEETRNEERGHIPIGFYHDLIDTHIDNFEACEARANCQPIICGIVNDQVSGFTNGQLFSLLTPDVQSPLVFKNKAIQLQPAAQSAINNLYNDYQ